MLVPTQAFQMPVLKGPISVMILIQISDKAAMLTFLSYRYSKLGESLYSTRGRAAGRAHAPVRAPWAGRGGSARAADGTYLVDPASSHMLVSKAKPCTCKHRPPHGEAANGSLDRLQFIRSYTVTWITVVILELIHATSAPTCLAGRGEFIRSKRTGPRGPSPLGAEGRRGAGGGRRRGTRSRAPGPARGRGPAWSGGGRRRGTGSRAPGPRGAEGRRGAGGAGGGPGPAPKARALQRAGVEQGGAFYWRAGTPPFPPPLPFLPAGAGRPARGPRGGVPLRGGTDARVGG